MLTSTDFQNLCEDVHKAIAQSHHPICAVELAMILQQTVPNVHHALAILVSKGVIEQDYDYYWCEHEWTSLAELESRRCCRCDRVELLPIVLPTGAIIASDDVEKYKLLKEVELKIEQSRTELDIARHLKFICDRKLYRFEYDGFYLYSAKTLGYSKEYVLRLLSGLDVIQTIESPPFGLKEKSLLAVKVRLSAIVKTSKDLQQTIGKHNLDELVKEHFPTSPIQVESMVSLLPSDRLEVWYMALGVSGGQPEEQMLFELSRSKLRELAYRKKL